TKVDALNRGESYIRHINHGRLQEARASKKITATSNFQNVENCDVIIMCVPTPLDHHLQPDLRYIIQTTEAIAPYLQPHTLVSLESTTWPGTTEEIVKPIIETKGKISLEKDLYLCF